MCCIHLYNYKIILEKFVFNLYYNKHVHVPMQRHHGWAASKLNDRTLLLQYKL